MQYYEKAAQNGESEAQKYLGEYYYIKAISAENDVVQAAQWYQKSAEQNYIEAQYCLAECYKNGKGVQQNDIEAFKWYEKAAQQGHIKSQYNLACCYENGIGVEKIIVTHLNGMKKLHNKMIQKHNTKWLIIMKKALV